MKKPLFLLLLAICASGFANKLSAQEWAIKTNLLYDATASMNIGLETALSDKWTFDLSGNWNPFEFSENKKWKHWLVQPEFRYWACRKFGGHFLAMHLWGGQYNVGGISGLPDFLGNDLSKLEHYRYEGWVAGAGVGYGYAWMLGKHWNLEAEIAIGYGYTRYDKFECVVCGRRLGDDKHHYFGPTKAAINLVYLF
ncbi:MAG: DUF3575 domain-containing protein [Alistipes sp.]|nr:DUF3575 domain-containing protein [Alistipes sp.]